MTRKNKFFLAAILWANLFLIWFGWAYADDPSYFVFTKNTGNTAHVAVQTAIEPTVHGLPLEAGDEIGVFTLSGLCVGASVWTGDSNIAIAIWGDNQMTPEIDGAQAGERIVYRLWRKGSETEYAHSAFTYSQGSGFYSPGGIWILSSLEFTDVDTLGRLFTTAIAPPGQVVLLNPPHGALNISLAPTLTWEALEDADHYEIQVMELPTGDFIVQDTTSATEYTLANLKHNTTYRWQVRGWNDAGAGIWSGK
jgi:hypothetical protein